MRVAMQAALLVVISVSLVHPALINNSVQRQIKKLTAQIDIAYDLLESDCPTRVRRTNEKFENQRRLTDLEILKIHYNRLVRELVQCRAYEGTTNIPTTHIDCQELHENGIRTPGIYTLQPMRSNSSFEAWCDFDAAHGWTVIQRRQDSTNFYLYWADYKAGFGDLEGSYWLGNDNIHALTRTNQKLSVFLRRYDGAEASANYTTFIVNDESDKYKLTISGYSGNASDSLNHHNDTYFSTRDRDNDRSGGDCAEILQGAWWYNACYSSNLNGLYCASSGTVSHTCANWYGSFGRPGGSLKSLTKIVMRVTRD